MTNGNENTYEHLVGLDQTEAITFLVEAAPTAGSLVDTPDSIGNMHDAQLSNRILFGQHKTPLDRCLTTVMFDRSDRQLPVNISTPRDIVVMTAFPGETMPTMILYPPSVTRQKLAPGIIDIPVFNIDYIIRPIPPMAHVDCVSSAMNTLRSIFEGTCCHELLLKAVRSQRNVIKGTFDHSRLREAIAMVERGCHRAPNRLLLNSEAFGVIRDDVEQNWGLIYDLEPIVFNPTRRGVEGRNYVLNNSFEIGVLFRSGEMISRERELSGDLAVHLTTSIGAVVTNRSALASIEG